MDRNGFTNALPSAVALESGIANSGRILLRRVFRILRACGLSDDQLSEMATTAISQLDSIPQARFSRVTATLGFACCDVVLKWRRDLRFNDDNGNPRTLAFNEDSPSFSELVRIAAPTENPSALAGALLELEAVRIVEDGRLELISDSVVTCSGKEGSAIASESVMEHVCGFLGSVEFNLLDKPSRSRGKFERACYAWVPRKFVPVLENLVSARGQEFVDVIDEWLARRSAGTTPGEDAVLVGAGAYVFVRDRFGPLSGRKKP